MPGLRAEEVWATQLIEASVGAPVHQHDDGSSPGMYDLDIAWPGRPPGAVEVTTATDSDSVELWKIINGSRETWTVLSLAGGWRVDLWPSARGRRVIRDLPALLKVLEGRDQRDLQTEWTHDPDPVTRWASDLGIVSAVQDRTNVPGSIYPRLELPANRTGGAVPATGDPVSTWLPTFLREPAQADVLRKLARSGAEDRHAFVIVPIFSTAPYGVVDLLVRDDGPVPTATPDLPPEVSHAWVVSSWNAGHGLRWSPDGGWATFSKVQD